MKSVRLDDESVKETTEYPCEHTVEGAPVEKLRVCYVNEASNFKSGMWEMTVGKKYFECGIIDEGCFLIEGEVIITDSEGNSETYVGGQSFVLPAGFKGHWETVKPVRKFWAMHFNK